MFLVSRYISNAAYLFPANRYATPPGTSNIYEQADDRSDQVDTTRLKHDWTTKEPTILVPQPSDDPNDPLVCLAEHPILCIQKLMSLSGIRIGRFGGAT